MILRPGFDPEPHRLPPGAAVFLASLQAGNPLIAALAGTAEGFDLTETLGLLLQGNAVIGITP